ncbi:MAG: PilX N-terminal domain-containing pilus assembly protein [Rudaea sp.]|uniref:pilus assembly PilX family protein n=1 Tax=Rudaea sp. TaxID=2136325 RepID=UPI0039E39539
MSNVGWDCGFANCLPRSQRGAVLFVSLIMLLLLTIIGLAAMQGTLLQERMSGSFRSQQQAFEQGEGDLQTQRNLITADAISNGPLLQSTLALFSSGQASWQAWLTQEPTAANSAAQVNKWYSAAPNCSGAGGMAGSSSGPCFYVVTVVGQNGPSGRSASAVVQGIFIF